MPDTPHVLERYQEVLARFPKAEKRTSQEAMVAKVAEALETEESLVIEAGTGSGKSFGYLIPALLQERRPVVISTATIALQEQLINKDIPFVAEALGLTDLKVKMVKGRGNYLCIQKLQELERSLGQNPDTYKTTGNEMLHIQYLKGELQDEWSGDFGDLDLSLPRDVLQEVRSDAEDCLGPRCQYYRENPYRMAREDLDEADVIVSNHALYLQDLVAGKSLLPPHEVVIFDEAHQIKNYALNALTVRIGKFATVKLLQKIGRRIRPVPEEFVKAIYDAEAAIMDWLFARKQETFKLYPDARWVELVSRQASLLSELEAWLGGVNVKQLKIVATDLDADRAAVQKTKLINQLQGLTMRWEYFLETDPLNVQRVNWVEVNSRKLYYELKSTPLNIADTLRDQLWQEKTAILTSATLAVNGSMAFTRRDLGIEESAASVLPSPFKYATQCALYLPDGIPDPNSEQFPYIIAEEIEKILNKTQGRAFVLFTSYKNMRAIADALIPKLDFPCRVQGELPRQRLLDWFKEAPNSVIFATATFWEGIDIPGDDLTAVIIDKIPFASPGDPVNQAVVDLLKARGEDWFSGFALPQAVIKLKQGFGRLIRGKNDTGMVAILDPRLKTKGYGRIILNSLPKTAIAYSLDEVPDELVRSGKTVAPASTSSV